MNSNTTQKAATVTTLPSTPKPQTSKEVIAANAQLLIEQLEAGPAAVLLLAALELFRDAISFE